MTVLPDEPAPIQPRVFLVDSTSEVDHRLPEGQLLIEVFPDGEIHLAYRRWSWDTWPYGLWQLPEHRNNGKRD